MIISKIIGGLGNQMFQYAVGRAVSLERRQSLLADISGFSNYGLHNGFELRRIFNCEPAIASDADVRCVLGRQYSSPIRKFVTKKRLAFLRPSRLIIEPHFHYWSGINNVPSDCYLDGYWQSEKYFREYESVLRSDFSFKTTLSELNTEIADLMTRHSSVSIHVRRGDYVSNKLTNSRHGLCPADYYRRAVQHIAKNVQEPYFFVFSDDIPWAMESLQLSSPCRYIDHNKGSESYNDMRLMSMCRHHIIANSTFSWWGAWLNPRVDKIVVAPQKWFAMDCVFSDIYPQGWVTV